MYNSAFFTLLRQSWRSIMRNWRRTLITVSAISMGIGLAIFFMALGQGVYQQMINSVVRSMGGHFTIEHVNYREAPAIDLLLSKTDELRAKILELPNTSKSKAIIFGQAVYRSAHGTTGGMVMGVEPAKEREVSELPGKIVDGHYLSESDFREVIIGKAIAERLRLKVGRKLVISTNNAEGELSEHRFKVKGIFETKSPELDASIIQMTIRAARSLFSMQDDQVTQLGFLVHDLKQRDQTLATAREIVTETLGDQAVAIPWEQVQKALADYIKLDRGSNWIMQSILIFLSLFTIWNTILMSVLERSREFGVMLALGTSSARIRTQVAIESAFISVLGALLGIAMGGGLAWRLSKTGLDIMALMGGQEINVAGFSMSGMVYPSIEPDTLLWFGGVVVVSAILMSGLASRNVLKICIADVLR